MTTPLPVPRYHQVYLLLRERVAGGDFAGKASLPGELELARDYRVSRVTIRSALQLLVKDRLITRHRGRGTFVRPVEAQQAAPPVLGLLENLITTMGLKTTVRVLEIVALPASPAVAEALRIPAGELVQRVARLRSHQGGPVSHLTTFVPTAVARFRRRMLSVRPMLQLLEEAGVKVAGAEQVLSAKLADPTIAPLLDVDVGAPLLAVTRVVHDQAGRHVQLLYGLYRPDRYQYRMRLTRSGDDIPRVWVSNDSVHRWDDGRRPRATMASR